MAKTVIGLFDTVADAQATIRDLTDNGFPRSDISLMSRSGTTAGVAPVEGVRETAVGEGAAAGAGVGAALGGIGGLVVGLGALTIPGVGPILAAGPLVAALTGAGIGAGVGALVGALVGMGVPEDEAGYYAEGVRRGGTLVSVAVPETQVDLATDVMKRHNPVDIKQRSADWRTRGWTGYNPSAKPYTEEEMEAERSHWSTPRNQGPMTGTGFRSGTGTTMGTGWTSREEVRHFREIEADPDERYDPSAYADYEDNFRTSFQKKYANRGYTYDEYVPVYHYAYFLATSPRYADRDWYDIESDARARWERRNPGTWEQIKDTIRDAWENIKAKVR